MVKVLISPMRNTFHCCQLLTIKVCLFVVLFTLNFGQVDIEEVAHFVAHRLTVVLDDFLEHGKRPVEIHVFTIKAVSGLK